LTLKTFISGNSVNERAFDSHAFWQMIVFVAHDFLVIHKYGTPEQKNLIVRQLWRRLVALAGKPIARLFRPVIMPATASDRER
jgi:hypothetical protein